MSQDKIKSLEQRVDELETQISHLIKIILSSASLATELQVRSGKFDSYDSKMKRMITEIEVLMKFLGIEHDAK